MDMGLPAAEQAANTAAASTPEASQLAQELASRARGELPDKLAHMQVAEALSKQTAAEAAAARSPEAIAAMEKQMRSETARRLLMRYVLPSAGGYVAGEMAGGHGGVGAIAGFGARPMARAVLRGLASPGFTAPASRALAGGAEALSSLAPSAERAAISLSPAIASALEDEMPSVPKLQQLLAELQKKRSDQMVGSNP